MSDSPCSLISLVGRFQNMGFSWLPVRHRLGKWRLYWLPSLPCLTFPFLTDMSESGGVVLGVRCHRSTAEMALSLLFPKATGLRDFLASILTFSLLLTGQASIFWAIWHSWSSGGPGKKQHAQTRHSEKHFQRCGQETTRGSPGEGALQPGGVGASSPWP